MLADQANFNIENYLQTHHPLSYLFRFQPFAGKRSELVRFAQWCSTEEDDRQAVEYTRELLNV